MDGYLPVLCWLLFCPLALSSPCLDHESQPITTCSQCLSQLDCEWCPDQKVSGQPALGCIVKNNATSTCVKAPVVSRPKITDERGKPISNVVGNYVQIFPQEIDLSSSPNHQARVHFDVDLAEVPVDIYFVMDLSNSMHDHRDNLEDSTEMISKAIKKLTKDCRFGFGSFSDKPAMPFSAELSWYHSSQGQRSQPDPYSFHHQMPLTPDIAQFRKGVSEAQLSGNVDSAESGMDALMQAITCDDQIGWRDEVRKVIVFITDEDTHYALDGEMAGIPKPQDNQCHLKKKSRSRIWEYSMSLEQDYPSFGQIRDQLKDKNMAVVFAVGVSSKSTAVDMTNLYRELSVFIQGTENVGRLTRDVSSIVGIVEGQYRAIKSTIVLKTETSHGEDKIAVEIKSGCSHKPNPNDPTIYTCTNVKESERMEFELAVTLKDEALCQAAMKLEDKYVEVSLAGFPKDRLRIQLKCEQCNCGREAFSSRICNGKGSLICGGCECYSGFFGKACQCAMDGGSGSEGSASVEALEQQCRAQGLDDDAPLCNNRGKCTCGQCSCDNRYLGEFCQCSRSSCPTSSDTGSVCSGQGTCKCNTDTLETSCTCSNGWTGSDCSCTQSEETCKDAYTGEVCFGRGLCKCGKCSCESGFEGKFCQKETAVSSCQRLESCVKWREFTADKLEDPNALELIQNWKDECLRQTSFDSIRLFDFENFSHWGCPLQRSNDSSESENMLLYKINIRHNCAQTLKEFWEHEANEDDEREESSILTRFRTVSGPTRGDLSSSRDILDSFGAKRVRTSGMERCVGVYDNCEFTFYHDHIQDDDYFTEKQLRNVYIVHRNVSGNWQAINKCYTVSMATVIGGTVGSLLFIGLALLVAAVVIINLNDLRRWQQYQAWKSENEQRLGEHSNPLYQDKGSTQTTVQNPAFMPSS